MAEFNSCAKLKSQIEEGYKKHDELCKMFINPFETMMDMQKTLQIELNKQLPHNNKHPDNLENIGEIFEWIRDQKQSIDDEYRELIDALPGMSLPEKDRSAIWKKWKSKYSEIRKRKISDLSEEDLLELKFEATDIIFFYMNILIALGVNGRELFAMYYAKNIENFNRYNSNY